MEEVNRWLDKEAKRVELGGERDIVLIEWMEVGEGLCGRRCRGG